MNVYLMIELKKEFSSILTHTLTPIIYDQLLAMCNECKKSTEPEKHISTFQKLLCDTPNWKSTEIDKAVKAIESKNKNDWLFEMIISIIKINMVLYDYGDLEEEPKKSDGEKITMGDFVHAVFCECARELFVHALLFHETNSPSENYRNKVVIFYQIGIAIENAFRRILPMKQILQRFLGIENMIKIGNITMTQIYPNDVLIDLCAASDTTARKFMKQPEKLNNNMLNQVENTNIPVVNQEFIPVAQPQQEQNGGGFMPNMPMGNNMMSNMQMVPNMPMGNIPMGNMMMPMNNMPMGNMMPPQNMPMNNMQMPMNNMMAPQNNMYNGMTDDTLEKNVNAKILNILQKNNVLTDSHDNNNFTVNNHSVHQGSGANGSIMAQTNTEKKSSSALKRIIRESIKQSHHSATKSNSVHSEIKNKILKELDSATEYKPEENADNYQDVFSNSDVKNTINTNEKVEKKTREKFFNNYLVI